MSYGPPVFSFKNTHYMSITSFIVTVYFNLVNINILKVKYLESVNSQKIHYYRCYIKKHNNKKYSIKDITHNRIFHFLIASFLISFLTRQKGPLAPQLTHSTQLKYIVLSISIIIVLLSPQNGQGNILSLTTILSLITQPHNQDRI